MFSIEREMAAERDVGRNDHDLFESNPTASELLCVLKFQPHCHFHVSSQLDIQFRPVSFCAVILKRFP